MIKVIGKVSGVLTDINTNEKREAFKPQTNHVQDAFLKDFATALTSGSAGHLSFGDILFVSTNQPKKQRRDWNYLANGTIGEDIVGITSPEYTFFKEPEALHLKQLTQRFPAPAADRDIYTIGVTASTQASIDTGNAVIDAVVSLDLPCTQLVTETLDVFYRLQITYDPTWADSVQNPDVISLTPYELYLYAEHLLGTKDYYPLNAYATLSPTFTRKSNPRSLVRNKPRPLDTLTGLDATNGVVSSNSTYFRGSMLFVVPISQQQGILIGNLAIVDSDTAGSEYEGVMYTHKLFGNEEVSPVHSIFGHSSIATGPFFDSGTTQTGLGTIGVDGSLWIDPDYPKILKIKVEIAGAIGIGAYKIQYRNLLGVKLNTYDNRPVGLPGFAYHQRHFTEGFSFPRNTPEQGADAHQHKAVATIMNYDKTHVVAGWTDELCIANVLSQEGKNFNSTTTPELPVTNITQFCVNKATGDVFVACRNTGAYRITSDQTTVDTFNSATTGLTGVTGCYGIGIGASGRIWAFFDGTTPGMYYSDDLGVNWTNQTFSFAAIDATASLVKHIHVDPSHVNNHVAVCYSETKDADEEYIKIAWWDGAAVVAVAGAAVQGPVAIVVANYGAVFGSYQDYTGRWVEFTSPVTYFNSFSCSPNDNFWFTPSYKVGVISDLLGQPTKLNFGTAVVDTIVGADISTNSPWHAGWGVDQNGDDAAFCITARGYEDSKGTATFGTVALMIRSDLTYDSTKYSNPTYGPEGDAGLHAACYMGEGLFMVVDPYAAEPLVNDSTFMYFNLVCITPNADDALNFKNETYPEYGWDGANWVKGHAGTKLFHSAAEDVIDGIQVNFDDSSGTTDFHINDYYTVTIHDGVQMDGATTFEQDLDIYFKPVKELTDIETGVIPASTRIPNELLGFTPQSIADWQDTLAINAGVGTLSKQTTGTVNVYDCGCRSLDPVILGTTSQLADITRFGMYDITNIQGYLEFKFEPLNNDSYKHQMIAGISGASVLGTAINKDTVEFGLVVDNSLYAVSGRTEISVIESGVISHTIDNYYVTHTYDTYEKCRIILLTDGTLIYEFGSRELGWHEIYKTAPGHAAIKDYYMDVTMGVGYGNTGYGLKTISSYSYVPASNYLYLGNGVDTGAFDANFKILEEKNIVVLIGGIEAVMISLNDTSTVLAANTYSLFPASGVIRVSIDDVGKTISAKYILVTNE